MSNVKMGEQVERLLKNREEDEQAQPVVDAQPDGSMDAEVAVTEVERLMLENIALKKSILELQLRDLESQFREIVSDIGEREGMESGSTAVYDSTKGVFRVTKQRETNDGAGS